MDPDQTRAKGIGFVLFLLLLAALIFGAFCKYSGVGVNSDASIDKMIDGSAKLPFVQRVLVPKTARLIAPLIPMPVVDGLGSVGRSVVGDTWNTFFYDRMGGSRFPREAVAMLLIMYGALVGFAITVWRLARQLGNGPMTASVVATLLLVGCGALTINFGYIYDYTQAFLFSAALLMLYRQKWVPYLCICAIGALNKETFLLIYPVFAIYYFRRLEWKRFVYLSVAQAAIFGIVRLILLTIFKGNEGVLAQWHFWDQIDAINEMARNTPLLLTIQLLILASCVGMVIYRWGEKSAFLRTGMCIVPLFLVLYMLWGFPSEFRVFLEVLPIVGLLMVPPPRLGQSASAAVA